MSTQIIPPPYTATEKHFQLSGFDKACCTNNSLPLPRLSFLNSPTTQKMRWRTWYLSSRTISSFSPLRCPWCSLFGTCKLTCWSSTAHIQTLRSEPQVRGVAPSALPGVIWRHLTPEATDERYGEGKAAAVLRDLTIALQVPFSLNFRL